MVLTSITCLSAGQLEKASGGQNVEALLHQQHSILVADKQAAVQVSVADVVFCPSLKANSNLCVLMQEVWQTRAEPSQTVISYLHKREKT